MRIAVTGAAGHLGSVVLRRLAVERDLSEILAIDLRPPTVPSPRIKPLRADVRDPALAEALRGCDALIHLAFIVTGFPPRQLFDDVNVNGSRNVFSCAVAAGVKRVVYSSSIAAYGVVPGHPVPIVEDTPRVHQRDFAYASAKFEVEAILDELEPRHPEVSFARLRPAIFIGAQMDNPLGTLLRHRLLVDTGTTPLPLVWDEDVAEAIVLAWQQGARGPFNLAAEAPQTSAELARACGLRLLPLTARVQLHLTGPGGGDIALSIDDGKVAISREVLRPPTTAVTMRATLFRQLLAGQGDFNTAQMTGKVRVEGEALAALVVPGLINTFRARAGAPGAAGLVPRALSRWFGRGDQRAPRSER